MSTNINKYRYILLVSTLILTIFGVFMVYESSNVWASYLYNDQFYFLKRQIIYALIGIVMFFVGSKLNLDIVKRYYLAFLIVSFILLILVIIPGIGITKNGSTSWIGLNEFSFQPSELFKFSIILYFSRYLSLKYEKTNSFKNFLLPLICVCVGFGLIMLQPDFGSAMIIGLSIIILVFCSRLKIKWFVILSIICLLAVGYLIISAPYRFERIESYIDPFKDPLGSGFQIIQSLYALGPGGLCGKGINGSIQKHFYLPEPQTDFIFAIVGEEFGLIGCLIIIIIYSLIFYSSYKIIIRQKDLFRSYFFLGLVSIILTQVIINLGVVSGLLPVTGITLPLISYGGTSLVVILFSLGIIYGGSK